MPASALSLAEQLIDQGRFEQARATLMRHLQKNPRDAQACSLLAAALTFARNTEQALFYARRAHSLLPDDVNILSNLANVLAARGKSAEAIERFREVITRAPDLMQVRQSLAALLLNEHRNAEAGDLAREGLTQRPDDVGLTTLLAGSHLGAGRAAEALLLFELAVARDPQDQGLLIARATTSNYVDGLDPSLIADYHRAAGEGIARRAGPPMTTLPRTTAASNERSRLRVGFVSSDLRRHSVAFFIEPILRALGRSRFETICFSSSPAEDPISARLRSLVSQWHPIHALSDASAADLIRRSGIDILIDLAGLGAGNRLGIFALAPAPVQATYLGYPNTTGLSSVHFRLVDAITDPPSFEPRCTEKLIRLPHCFVCYSPLDQQLPEPAPRRRAPNDGPVFGSFNSLRKLTDSTVQLWARLVASVPNARLILKSAPFREERTREATAARFAAAGLDPSRLELLAWVDTDPMLLYERIDIALDPFPYNGTTTTCEALWMGVPVITLEGATHAGRVGTSLLTNLGLTDLIAKTADEYARIGAAVASGTGRLDTMRRDLRPLVKNRLGDAGAFARDFEAALEAAWSSAAP